MKDKVFAEPHDSVALVTGAGAGIGRACAESLAAAGFAVVATDLHEAAASETAALVTGKGGRAVSYGLDVTDEDRWKVVVEEVNQHIGRVAVLVNNAALKGSLEPGDRGPADMDLSAWDRMLNINLRGPMLGCRTVLPAMLDSRSGSIVMISSIAATRSSPNVGTAYTTAKCGLEGFMRMVAVSYGGLGIRCNSVAPGIIVPDPEAPKWQPHEQWLNAIGYRGGRPSDVAEAVVYLASDASGYVNGHVLMVDGGLSFRMPSPSVN